MHPNGCILCASKRMYFVSMWMQVNVSTCTRMGIRIAVTCDANLPVLFAFAAVTELFWVVGSSVNRVAAVVAVLI